MQSVYTKNVGSAAFRVCPADTGESSLTTGPHADRLLTTSATTGHTLALTPQEAE